MVSSVPFLSMSFFQLSLSHLEYLHPTGDYHKHYVESGDNDTNNNKLIESISI